MKVLLVDDHPLILSALKAMIEKLRVGVRVTACGSAAAMRDALAADPNHDLVLLDLQLGDALGFDLLRDLRISLPEVPVVVISASNRNADVVRCIDLGAMGFLPKSMATEALLDALRLVMAGGIYVPPSPLDGELDDESDDEASPAAAPAAATPATSPSPAVTGYPVILTAEQLGLTPRQYDVLLLLLQGKPNKDIARRLGLSVETVKDHVQAVLRALGVNSRTQAVLAVGRRTQALQRQQLAALAAAAESSET